MRKKIHIAVLSGGPSSEHDVSLKSGQMVLDALKKTYETTNVFIDRAGKWNIHPADLKFFADYAFIALHGSYGEDGSVQRELEDHHIPYTGSDSLASALGMNKFLSLRLFRDAGLRIPHTLLFMRSAWCNDSKRIIQKTLHYLHFPLVVKPNREGSSVGVSIVKNKEELAEAFGNCFSFSRDVLTEEFIKGREFTCGVLDHGWGESAYALLPTEIIPRVSHFFDYRAKYEIGGSFEVTPPVGLSRTIMREIRDTAVRAHRLIGASGFSRTDFILDENGKLHTIEINTIPGLTGESLLPKAASAGNISFSELIEKIIHAALFRYGKNFDF